MCVKSWEYKEHKLACVAVLLNTNLSMSLVRMKFINSIALTIFLKRHEVSHVAKYVLLILS
jgi:hypothetical protein